MMEAIKNLSAHTTVLLVEQNFIMASQLADRYTIIESGKSVRSGLMRELIDDEETIRRYLGAT
jgi:branched-chain amino acid transport system ATP-binding protein